MPPAIRLTVAQAQDQQSQMLRMRHRLYIHFENLIRIPFGILRVFLLILRNSRFAAAAQLDLVSSL